MEKYKKHPSPQRGLVLYDEGYEGGPDEEPSIGLILCAEKDHLDVEVALQDIGKPIGVAEYQYLLPKEELLKIVSSEMD